MLLRSVVIEVKKVNHESKLHKQVDQTVKPRSSKNFGKQHDKDTH